MKQIPKDKKQISNKFQFFKFKNPKKVGHKNGTGHKKNLK